MQSVRLIAITKPVTNEIFHENNDAQDLIVYCARVSNPSNQANFETGDKLLKYCIRKKHWSIFEMVNVVMEIKTTRDIGRQILRHRSFHFQEFSQRYAEVDTDLMEYRECRLQDQKNRQNSITTDDEELKQWWIGIQITTEQMVKSAYKAAIERGIAKEQARAILPEGMTPSVMYMNGTLRDWFHYCMLRMTNGTQKEHQDIAKMAWEILLLEFPFLREVDATVTEAISQDNYSTSPYGSYSMTVNFDLKDGWNNGQIGSN